VERIDFNCLRMRVEPFLTFCVNKTDQSLCKNTLCSMFFHPISVVFFSIKTLPRQAVLFTFISAALLTFAVDCVIMSNISERNNTGSNGWTTNVWKIHMSFTPTVKPFNQMFLYNLLHKRMQMCFKWAVLILFKYDCIWIRK